MQGWIKTHRCIMEKGIWENAYMFKVFSWCIMKASHKPHDQLVGRTTVELDRGQFVTGRKKAAIELNMKESTVWDYLKTLEKNESINIKSNNKFSIISVQNYGFYQSENEKSDNKPDNKPTTTRQQSDTNKNVKNGENEKKHIINLQAEDIWKAYPNKKGKADAMKKIPELIKKHGKENLLLYIDRYISTKEEWQQWMNGSTFFNGRYLDYTDDNFKEEPKAKPRSKFKVDSS